MIVLKESAFDGWLFAVVSLLAIMANLPEEFAFRYSINTDYFFIGLVLVLMFSLLRYARFGLVVTTAVLVVGANLPEHLAKQWNIAPEFMLFALCVMVGIAGINKLFDLMSVQRTSKYSSVAGTKALFKAISEGKVATVDRLIDGGVNVDARTITGKTPLMLAAYVGYSDIAHMLIKAGADVYARDKEGNSPLNIAQRKGFTRIARLLENAISRSENMTGVRN